MTTPSNYLELWCAEIRPHATAERPLYTRPLPWNDAVTEAHRALDEHVGGELRRYVTVADLIAEGEAS